MLLLRRVSAGLFRLWPQNRHTSLQIMNSRHLQMFYDDVIINDFHCWQAVGFLVTLHAKTLMRHHWFGYVESLPQTTEHIKSFLIPVIFDPASFYGHNEYDLGMMQMSGDFESSVFNAYHEIYPQTPKLKDRMLLYELFHHLNHWYVIHIWHVLYFFQRTLKHYQIDKLN